MYIYGSSQVHAPQPLAAPHRLAPTQTPQNRAAAGVDQLDISPEADLLSQVHNLPEVRQDRVNELRAQIASGTYETDANLDAALSRLLDEIG